MFSTHPRHLLSAAAEKIVGGATHQEQATTSDDAAFVRRHSANYKVGFEQVLDKLNLDAARMIALEIRQEVIKSIPPTQSLASILANLGKRGRKLLDCTIEEPPWNGYHSLVYVIRFSDGVKWSLKIPRRGHSAAWDSITARAFKAEANVMKLLKRETTIPVATVYAVKAATNNMIGCPFMMLEWIEGTPLSEYWDLDAPYADKLDTEKRVQLLQDLANAVSQLDKFQFKACGIPNFDMNSNITSIGAAIMRECKADKVDILARLMERGPFFTGDKYMNSKMELFRSQCGHYDESHVLFKLFISWFEEATEDRHTFVLAHRDLGPQNVLVDKDGRLAGIIDWDLAGTVPRYLSNGREGSYPHWLTRDLDLLNAATSNFSGASSRASSGSSSGSSSGDSQVYFSMDMTAGCNDLRELKPAFLKRTAFQPTQANFSLGSSNINESCARLFATKNKIEPEEQDYFRAIWRKCLENVSTTTPAPGCLPGNTLTVNQIIAQVPRTYAKGLTNLGAIDARLLILAAEYPNKKRLAALMDSFKYQMSRVPEGPPLPFDDASDMDSCSITDYRQTAAWNQRKGNWLSTLTRPFRQSETPVPNSPEHSDSTLEDEAYALGLIEDSLSRPTIPPFSAFETSQRLWQRRRESGEISSSSLDASFMAPLSSETYLFSRRLNDEDKVVKYRKLKKRFMYLYLGEPVIDDEPVEEGKVRERTERSRLGGQWIIGPDPEEGDTDTEGVDDDDMMFEG